jgi:hypothetical protein
MNKKIFLPFFVLIVFFLFLFNLLIFASDKTGSDSAKKETQKEVEILKEKIASKVAELRRQNFQAFSGKIVEIKKGEIEIKDYNEEKKKVFTDDLLTKYYLIKDNQKKEINFSDLKKDDYIIVSGVPTDKGISANMIFVDEKYLVDFGKIVEKDKNEYWLKVITLTNETISLDIEAFTKQWLLNIKSLELERTGFSKIKEGDMIHFVAKDKKNENNRLSAQKIVVIPQEYFLK